VVADGPGARQQGKEGLWRSTTVEGGALVAACGSTHRGRRSRERAGEMKFLLEKVRKIKTKIKTKIKK
jgi:hypothetical protein